MGRSQPVRNICFGKDEGFSWKSHYAFIWTTAGGGRQFSNCIAHIQADHRKIPVVEFPNIRASVATSGFSSVSVRVWADALHEIHTDTSNYGEMRCQADF